MIKLLLLGFVIAAAIWYFAYRAGVKTLEKDYEREYNDLVHAVHDFLVTSRNYTVIRKRFTCINRYSCRNKEMLDVLYRQFLNKFESVMPKAKNNAA